MQFPEALKKGDRIAILSPASPVWEEYIAGAERWIRLRGWIPVRMSHASGPICGSYAADDESRLHDFLEAWENPDIKAILCARGGYGTVRLLEQLSCRLPDNAAKWLIGFSDISALHALMLNRRIATIHGPMAKHLTERPVDAPAVMLERILYGVGSFCISSASGHPLNIPGNAYGRLTGGNLAVLNGLFGTPYDPVTSMLPEPVILFIEDISEKIYAVERMLYHIYLSGAFNHIKGLVVGRFTDYPPDRNFTTMEDMISAFLRNNGLTHIPVWFNAPIGHEEENYPVIEGARAVLSVTTRSASLNFSVS